MTELEISYQIISRLGLTRKLPNPGQRVTVRCPYHVDRHPSASKASGFVDLTNIQQG